MKQKRVTVRSRSAKRYVVAIGFGFLNVLKVSAQDGAAGIDQANTMVRQYFNSGVTLMYAIGAVVGLIGAVKVYNKWSSGHADTGQTAAAWFGSCIFLIVVATVLRSFFGL